ARWQMPLGRVRKRNQPVALGVRQRTPLAGTPSPDKPGQLVSGLRPKGRTPSLLTLCRRSERKDLPPAGLNTVTPPRESGRRPRPAGPTCRARLSSGFSTGVGVTSRVVITFLKAGPLPNE